MPFQPVLNNIGPALVASGFNNLAQTQLAGSQALAGGISQAGAGIAGGLGRALEGVNARATKFQQAAGQLDAYRQYGQEFGMDTSFLDGIEEKYGKDPDKLLGALSVVGQNYQRHQAMTAMNQQYAGALELAKKKAELAQPRAGGAPVFSGFVGQGIDMSR